jgi:hypothetical protein
MAGGLEAKEAVACVFFNVMNLWNRTLVAERSVRVQRLRVEYRLAAAAAGQRERGGREQRAI